MIIIIQVIVLYVKHILPIIAYGKYSKTFIHYFSEKNTNSDLSVYFNILKKRWLFKSTKLLTEIEAALKNCKNQGVYYLLLSNKLAVLKSMNQEKQMKPVYDNLKKEFENIPAPFRKLIAQTLSSIKASKQGNDLKELRKWSEIHLEDEMGMALKLNAEARTLVKEKKYNLGAFVHGLVFSLEYVEHAYKIPPKQIADIKRDCRKYFKQTFIFLCFCIDNPIFFPIINPCCLEP